MSEPRVRSRWWLLFVLGGLVAAAPAGLGFAAPEDGLGADPLEANRQLLDKWRADPEHDKRLQRDLHAFSALPPERQDRMRRFDRELHALDEKTRTRLWRVLDRYSTWLEQLPEEQRQKVLLAGTAAEKLQLIRDIRAQQWIDRLPLKLREEVLKQPAERRATFVAELRRQERAQRVVWMNLQPVRPGSKLDVKPPPDPVEKPKPKPSGKPSRLAELPTDVQLFVKERLFPRLTKNEYGRLVAAEGKWPELAQTIRKLADEHPVLPPGPLREITTYNQLPPTIQNNFGKDRFPRVRHQWPEYALAVSKFIKGKGKKALPLGASKLDEFPKTVQTFVRKELLPALSPFQKQSLRKLEGHWPEYPERLLELARQKRLVIPGMSLPGPSELWEAPGRS